MTAQQLGHHLAGMLYPKSLEVDTETYLNAIEAIILHNYDEDQKGMQIVKLKVRNNHIMFKGVELILNNKS